MKPVHMVYSSRNTARHEILKVVNRNSGWRAKPYSMRHIQEAVHIARKFRMVPQRVLIQAGYKAVK